MANAEMVRPFVEQQIAELLGVQSLKKDADGDIPIRNESSASFVRVHDGPTGPMLSVFAPIISDVKKSAKLLERINEMNVNYPFVRFFLLRNQIICRLDLLAENLNQREIGHALEVVGEISSAVDESFAKEFGGTTYFGPEEESEPSNTSDNPGGGYL